MIRLLVLALFAVATLLAQDEILELTEWRAREGDDARWARPDFDDRDWQKEAPLATGLIQLPRIAAGHQPVIWYRATYRIPSHWAGHALMLGIWKLDDAYEVYADGVKIGAFGSMPPPGSKDHQLVSAFAYRRMTFPILRELSGDGEVTIALRRWRLPVPYSWETHAAAPIPGAPLPVIGLTAAVERERRTLDYESYLRGLPGVLAWLVSLACGVLCLSILRKGETRELLWAGLALIASGVYWAISLPMTLMAGPAKNSLAAFGLCFGVLAAAHLFFGWFLAELVPRWRTWLRWASVLMAIGVAAPFVSTYLYSPPIEVTLGLRRSSFMVQCAISLGAAWVVWRSRLPGLSLVVLAIAVRAVTLAITNIWNSANYYSAGPFVISVRRTSDAVIAVAFAALLFVRARRERIRQKDLARDLEAARRVQETLLGAGDAAVPGFTVNAVCLPALEVGGDFYQTMPAGDGAMLVIVGDVSGKGLQAAMLVSSVIGSLRNEFSRSPGEVLAHLNRSLVGRTGGGFVTCCCARFDADATVTVANAGHLAPYADGRELEVEAGLPLGIAPDAAYTESKVAGTEFVFVSDGVVEAANPKGELFGFERTREIAGKSAQEIAAAAKAWGQNDDITVVTVRRSG